MREYKIANVDETGQREEIGNLRIFDVTMPNVISEHRNIYFFINLYAIIYEVSSVTYREDKMKINCGTNTLSILIIKTQNIK